MNTKTFYDVRDLKSPLNVILALPFDITDVELDIDYSIYGCNRPATFDDPEEHPELEVTSSKVISIITHNGSFTPTSKQSDLILSLLNNDDLDELLWYDAEVQKAAYEIEMEEYFYEN
ncbi:MAG: hypothetical protein WC707_07160 [Candidatus Babeliaceae bacterium]|jgi:hypothetical protein